MTDARDQSTPSDKELKAEIKKLSKKLGVEITPGKDRAELTAQLEELRAQSAAPPAPDANAPLTGGARIEGDARAGDGAAPSPRSAQRAPVEGDGPLSAIDRELEQLETHNGGLAERLRGVLRIDLDEELVRDPALLNTPEGSGAIGFLRELAKEVATLAPHIADELQRRATLLADARAASAARSARSAPARGGFKVAPGHSVVCMKGILGPNSPICGDDLYAGGMKRLEELADKGVLVRT